MTRAAPQTNQEASAGLRRDAIGLREVLFQSITDMAPGAAIAASIPAGVAFAGGSLPLSVVFAMVACLFCAWCIGLLAREMPAAGSLATYAARGLHPAVGFLVAWGYVLVGWLIPLLVLLQLGFTTAATLNSEFSGYPASLWWPWSLLGALIVLAAGYYGIRTSARLGTILGVSEIAVFVVLAVFLVVHAGSRNTLSVFGTGYTPAGFRGISGVIGGSVFTILAFGGFEGAAPLAEEARNPRRTIQRAILLATLMIGALYVFTTYAVDVAFGPNRFASFTTGTGTASWEGLARSLYGIFWFFVFLAIVNSTIANANAGVNVSSRTAYAMVGTGIVIPLAAIYILMNAACIGFFSRRGRDFNWLSHLIIPVLGIATFVPAWLTAAGIKVFSFVAPLTPPLSYMGPGVAGWMVVGVLYLIYLYRRDPRRVLEVGVVHLDPLEKYDDSAR
jgi:amino acid transporter